MGKSFYQRWAAWAKGLKRKTYALYLAYKDKRVPWYAKVFTAVVVAYAMSPIDFIPDFIPVLGYLDDLILIPLGIVLAVKMIPGEVMEECYRQANSVFSTNRPKNRIAALIIVAVWIFAFSFLVILILKKNGVL